MVAEGFYTVRFVREDYISLIEKFDNEPVGKSAFPDIENKDPFQPTLPDRKHLSAGEYFRRNMANCGGFLGGTGEFFTRCARRPASTRNWYFACSSPFKRIARVRESNW